MKKTILLISMIGCSLTFNAQTIEPQDQIEPQDETMDTNSDVGIKRAVDYLLKNKDLLHIKLDTRFDYQGKFGEDETEESSFRGQTLKLWFVGEIAPGVRYRVRHRLNKPQNPSERDNYAGATDQAFIELDAGSKWTFRLGKQSVQFGTFEYDYNPADVYVTTMCFDDLDAYKPGVNVAYKAGKQVLNLQVVNSDAPQFANDKYRKKAFAGLFLWEGSLFNDLIKTRYGYGAFQHDASKYYSWITLGTQLNINKFSADLDWYMGDRNMDFIAETDSHVRDQSAAVSFKYDFGKFKPLLKGTWNKRRNQETAANYITGGVQAGIEYYPFTDPLLKDLRFHAVYAYNRTNYNGGVYNNIEGINQNMVIAGMRWMFKIM